MTRICLYNTSPVLETRSKEESEIEAKIVTSKEVHLLSSEIEEFRLRKSFFSYTENQEKHASLASRMASYASQEGLSSPTKSVVEAAQNQLSHLGFEIENPIIEDLDTESVLPNFASRLLDTAAKIKKASPSRCLAVFHQELNSVQQNEVRNFIVGGSLDNESIASAIEKYLLSLQNQAQTAEILYRSGQSEYAQSVLVSMERRMGLY